MISKRELRAININVDPLTQDKCRKKCENEIPFDTKKSQIYGNENNDFYSIFFNQKEPKYESPKSYLDNSQPPSNLINKSSSLHILQKSISSLSGIQSFQLIQNENLLEQSRPRQNRNEEKQEFQEHSMPFFFHQTSNNLISQFLCQNLTRKNWKYMIYDQSKNSCIPVFRCFGCNRQFQIPSALGGHLSKCYKKKVHQDTVKMLKKNRSRMRRARSTQFIENNQIHMLTNKQTNVDLRKLKRKSKRQRIKIQEHDIS